MVPLCSARFTRGRYHNCRSLEMGGQCTCADVCPSQDEEMNACMRCQGQLVPCDSYVAEDDEREREKPKLVLEEDEENGPVRGFDLV